MTQDERNRLLRLADHVDVLVRYCACHMPKDRVDQYNAGAAAFWSIVQSIAGNDQDAAKLAQMVPAEVVPTPADWLERNGLTKSTS